MNDDLDISIAANQGPEECPVPCPRCGHPSTAIKVIDFPIILVLIVFFVWWTQRVIACPSCVRVKILHFVGINLFTMHITWPVYVIISIIPLIRSFLAGHSTEIVEILRAQPRWEPGDQGREVDAASPRIEQKNQADGSFKTAE